MLILLHAIWFQYMLPNLVYPEQGSIKQKNNKHVFPIIREMYMFMRIQWLEKIVVVHEFVMGILSCRRNQKWQVKQQH